MKFRCAGINTGIINGIGISYEIFFSGCYHDCPGCQNPDLQDFSYGTEIDTNDILYHLERYLGFYNSVVFTGGDPVYQPIPLYTLASKCKLPSVLYTGFHFEDIPENIRNVMTIIVDGLYIQELKTDGFPASRNQNIYINTDRITKEQLRIFMSSHPHQEINYYENTNNI